MRPLNAAQIQSTNVRDVFQRPLQDLRISVIDRCNFRCTYCMPEQESKEYKFFNREEWLTFEEILRLAPLFVKMGVTKIRLTGGEPLLRPNLTYLIRRLAQIPGIEDLALTTNGSLLTRHAASLREAGLHRLTVSLDSLQEGVFAKMRGRRKTAGQIREGIKAAEKAGFASIKINVVVQRGVNDHTVLELVEYFRGSGHILRFIEYMDVGNCNHWESKDVVPNRKIMTTISQRYPLKPAEPNYFGEVASRYLFADGAGEIGFISSVTQPFCGSCTRIRLSSDGKLYTCLFAGQGTDLRAPLREAAGEDDLLRLIQDVWEKRNDRYSENRFLFRSLKEKSHKVEMFQIGG